MPWDGKPKWDGKYVEFGPIEGKLFPVIMGNIPFIIQIEGSNDYFFMIFSTEEKLRDTVDKFTLKLGNKTAYSVGKIKTKKLVDLLIDEGIRIMCDPIVVDDNHTKWCELVRHGDVFKYVDPEVN